MRYRTSFAHIATVIITAWLALGPAHAGPWGSPKFTVQQSDDRFRADALTTISSDGNRISKKSIAGGIHIDKQGVYLNPVVTFDRNTHEIARLSLDLFNVSDRFSGIGAPNSFGRPYRVSFLTGEGAPIVLDVAQGGQRFGEPNCPAVTSTCTTSLIEGGLVTLSLEQYRRLMNATALAIKIDGSERSRVYEVADIAPTFIANLKTFHDTYLSSLR